MEKIKNYGKALTVTTLTQSLGTFIFVSPVFGEVFYFTDVPVYLALAFGGIALVVSRICGKYGGARIGAKICKMPITVQKYLGLTLLPHSGVSLVFTGIISSVLATAKPELASIVTGTIAAAAVINEIIAIIVSKKGFELAGEIKGK